MTEAVVTQIVTQLGAAAVLLVILLKLWDEYTKQAQWVRDQFEELSAKIDVLAGAAGVPADELEAQTALVKWRKRQSPENSAHGKPPG